jgi:hypothetical protein
MPGIVLILLGLLFLLPNFTSLTASELWPVVLVVPGIMFFILFFQNRERVGVLMPATVLTVIGALFLYCAIAGWERMSQLWPFFIIAPGLGFFTMYFLGKRERGLLVPAALLTGIGCFFLLAFSEMGAYIVSVILIIAGIVLLLNVKRTNQKS